MEYTYISEAYLEEFKLSPEMRNILVRYGLPVAGALVGMGAGSLIASSVGAAAAGAATAGAATSTAGTAVATGGAAMGARNLIHGIVFGAGTLIGAIRGGKRLGKAGMEIGDSIGGDLGEIVGGISGASTGAVLGGVAGGTIGWISGLAARLSLGLFMKFFGFAANWIIAPTMSVAGAALSAVVGPAALILGGVGGALVATKITNMVNDYYDKNKVRLTEVEKSLGEDRPREEYGNTEVTKDDMDILEGPIFNAVKAMKRAQNMKKIPDAKIKKQIKTLTYSTADYILRVGKTVANPKFIERLNQEEKKAKKPVLRTLKQAAEEKKKLDSPQRRN